MHKSNETGRNDSRDVNTHTLTRAEIADQAKGAIESMCYEFQINSENVNMCRCSESYLWAILYCRCGLLCQSHTF